MDCFEEEPHFAELRQCITETRQLVEGKRNAQRRQRMKAVVGGVMPDPCSTQHDSWIAAVSWLAERAQGQAMACK